MPFHRRIAARKLILTFVGSWRTSNHAVRVQYDRTPLHFAAFNGHLEAVRWLIDQVCVRACARIAGTETGNRRLSGHAYMFISEDAWADCLTISTIACILMLSRLSILTHMREQSRHSYATVPCLDVVLSQRHSSFVITLHSTSSIRRVIVWSCSTSMLCIDCGVNQLFCTHTHAWHVYLHCAWFCQNLGVNLWIMYACARMCLCVHGYAQTWNRFLSSYAGIYMRTHVYYMHIVDKDVLFPHHAHESLHMHVHTFTFFFCSPCTCIFCECI